MSLMKRISLIFRSKANKALDRAEADRILSALGKRVFLLHNVHEKAPVVFQTRWTLSYLRGPLSRDQIAEIVELGFDCFHREVGAFDDPDLDRRAAVSPAK